MDEQIPSTVSRNVSRSRGKFLLFMMLAIGLIAAAVWAISWSLNTHAVTNVLVHQIEQRTGHRLEFEDLELRLFSRPRLVLRHVKMFDRQLDAPLLSATHVDVALQIGPLLEGRAVATQVVLEHPLVTVRRDPSGQWTIGERKPETASEKKGTPFGFLALVRNLLIVDGGITIVDRSGSVQTDPLLVTSLQLTMTEDIAGRSVKIQVSGEIPQGSADSALLNIDGSLVLLNGTDEASPQAAALAQAEGTIRIHRLDVRHVAGAFGLRPLPSGSFPPVQLLGHLRLVPRSAGYDLIVADWRAGFSDVSLQGTATVTGLGTAEPRVSADLSSSSVPLKQTLNQVPVEWIHSGLRNTLSEHAVEGSISVHDTHVEGALGRPEHLRIAGTAEIRDGRFLPGGTHPAVRDLSATVLYDLGQIRVTALRGNYGPVRLSDGTVLITEWRQEPMVDARISGEVRAPDLVALLNNQGNFSQRVLNLSHYEQVTGEVGMVAHVAGRPGKGGLDIEEVSIAIHNLGFRHHDVSVPFRQIEAAVRILPKEVRLDHLSGQAGFARVEAGGRVTLADEPSFQGVALTITADGEDLAPWLHGAGGETFKLNVDGPVSLSASITGHVRTPHFQGRLALDETDFHVADVFDKAKGAPAGIRFEGRLQKDLLLSVRRCEFILPPVRLTGEGLIRLANEWEFRAKIRSDALSLGKLPRGVKFGSVSAGVIEAGLTMEGRAMDRASWVTSGRLRFDKGMVEGQFQDPIKNLFVRLRFNGKNIDIQQLTFTVGDSDMRLSGSITDWLDAPRAKLVVQSPQIDVASLKPVGPLGSSASNSPSAIGAWWANGSLDATVLIDYLYYRRSLVSGLSCRIQFDHGSLKIDRISGDTDDGHLAGRVILNIPERGSRWVRSTFGVSGVPIDHLLSLVEEQPRINGWMTAKGGVQAEFGQDRVFHSSITSRRPISIMIEQGRLFYAPVISKVLVLINLPALLKGKTDLTEDGVPFDRLKFVFGVEHGIIHISEFLLDSPILKISGTARYDFIDDTFDGVVVASPLGQYFDLLKSVPLFGKLFSGERHGFDTAIFEVKGSAKDPTVVYLPAESLMAGAKGTAKLAFDLLVNAITLPEKAFSMAEGDSPVEEDGVQEGTRGL
ncbi:MAG: hypothetical protein OJF51_002735 [Nitrospira sp.]|nr:MAG: hypothetical protein OJF51_002735 [Nitrospira sp.]